MTSEIDLIAATEVPGTRRSLVADLRALGVGSDDVVIVHSSLSRLGWVAGGPQAVVEALLEVAGPEGTVVMPTQSGNLSDPANWSNPPVPPEWVDVIRGEAPVFDPRLTPTRGMGAIVDCFRQHPETIRSSHPLVSFAANGPAARAIVGVHPRAPSLGDPSPLGRLYDLDAAVLLLGIDHGNNTSLHLAEHRARWAAKPTRREGFADVVDGERVWVAYDDVAHDDNDFAEIGEAFAATGQELDGPVGSGRGRLCKQRAIVDFAVDWIEANR